MSNLVNAPMCTVIFTDVSCKRQLEHIHARFRMRLSGEVLTSMPPLLRVGNLFLRLFTLTVLRLLKIDIFLIDNYRLYDAPYQ